MKSEGIVCKNIAAILLLLALCSMLLPFIKISTPSHKATVSGVDLIVAGVRTSCEYYSHRSIADDFLIKGSVTWGDLKSGLNQTLGEQVKEDTIKSILFLVLPILCCFLAMIFSLSAVGKKSMMLPTILSIGSFVGGLLGVIDFPRIQNKLFSGMETASCQIGLLIGVYAFVVFCGIAMAILLIGYLLGFYDSVDEKEKKSVKKKTKTKHITKKKKGKKRTKKEKKKSKDDSKNDSKNDSENREAVAPALGLVSGISGRYEDVKIDLSEGECCKVTIRATEEPVENGKNFVIEYDRVRKRYHVTSHTSVNLILQTKDGENLLISNGESKTIGGCMQILVGDSNQAIRLQ